NSSHGRDACSGTTIIPVPRDAAQPDGVNSPAVRAGMPVEDSLEQQADLQKLRIERDIKPGAQPRRRRWRKRIVLLLLAGADGVLWLRYGDRLKGPPEVEITTVTLAYPSQEITAFNATGY